MPRDYPEYEDESPEETYRDPLKPFLIALVVLLLLFAAIIVLLYMRLQTANTRAETLSQELTAVQVQLDDLRAQRAAETPTPTPTEAPTPTPEPTPEPTATPEPTPEPTPTPAPLLRDTITAEMLGYVYRPADEFWYDEAKTAAVIPSTNTANRAGFCRISFVVTFHKIPIPVTYQGNICPSRSTRI